MVKITCTCGAYFQTDTMLHPSNGVTIGTFIDKFMKEHRGCIAASREPVLSRLAIADSAIKCSKQRFKESSNETDK